VTTARWPPTIDQRPAPRDSTYAGLKAETWDLFEDSGPDAPDRAFFLDLIRRSGEPVLDVCCGTGRLLLDFLALGIDVDGVDASQAMLDLCRAKAERRGLDVHLYRQSMERLRLARNYRTVMVASGSFQLLTQPKEARLAMECLVDALAPGGTLCLCFMLPPSEDDLADAGPDGWRLSREVRAGDDGLSYRMWSRQRFDRVNQLEHLENRIEALRDNRVVRSEEFGWTPVTRWYTPDQAIELMAAAGLVEVSCAENRVSLPGRSNGRTFFVLGGRD
jgi:SAM-dependent methyltransferase